MRGRSVDERGKQEPSVGRSEQRIDSVLGMGHEPHDVAGLVDDTGHVAQRAVHVLGVAQHDLATGGELDERPLVRVPGTLPVLDGDDEPLPDGCSGA